MKVGGPREIVFIFQTEPNPFASDVFCDLPLGLFIVRGDNIVVFGEIDNEKEEALPLQRVTQEVLMSKIASGKQKNTLEWNTE